MPSAATLAPSPADFLDARTIRRWLSRGVANDDCGEWQVRVVATTGSTNSDLLASLRADGFAGPTLLAAEHQTAGRGRLGRVWDSAAGASLTVSFALRVARPMGALDGVTLVCGLAACDAIGVHGVEARLKWPNDLLVDGRKLAGILVEVLPVPEGTVLVVGIGVNLEADASSTTGGLPATDLRTSGGGSLDRNHLIATLGLALRARLATFATHGFAPFVDEWNRRDAFRDQPVALVVGADVRVTGIERGVDAGGALLIDTEDGPRRIVSGDLSLRLAGTR